MGGAEIQRKLEAYYKTPRAIIDRIAGYERKYGMRSDQVHDAIDRGVGEHGAAREGQQRAEL